MIFIVQIKTTFITMKQRIRLTEGDLRRIIRKCVNEAFNDIDNLNDYVSQNNLSWRPASKFQRVNAQSGKAYMNQYARDNKLSKGDRRALGRKGAPLETIASDGTRETNNRVGLNQTVLNNIGNVDNRWAVDNKTFNRKYEQDPFQNGVYKPKGGPMNATQINEPISFNAPWGERMNIDKGGYLLQDPNNINDIYGISQKDFDNTYKFDESLHRIIRTYINEAINEADMSEREGSLSNLCMKLLSNDCEILKKQGTLPKMKQFIAKEVKKLKGTSELEKKKFLQGNMTRGYSGILGADSFQSLQVRIANVFTGGDGYSPILYNYRRKR
jgi:hypothetical protein